MLLKDSKAHADEQGIKLQLKYYNKVEYQYIWDFNISFGSVSSEMRPQHISHKWYSSDLTKCHDFTVIEKLSKLIIYELQHSGDIWH